MLQQGSGGSPGLTTSISCYCDAKLEVPRDPDGWPEARPRPVPPYTGVVPAPEAALRGLSKAAFHACAALATHFGKPSPGFTQDEDLARANAVALLDDLAGDAFVQLRGGR